MLLPIRNAHPHLAYSGTANREATHSVQKPKPIARYPSQLMNNLQRLFPQTIASSPAYSLTPLQILLSSHQSGSFILTTQDSQRHRPLVSPLLINFYVL
ncbi:hypothetical protein TNIN_193651 [Trichonephila inaurata madagascariensis]|uniref:Uncharacterized protein n=1 Tax=Trichonephila inaurata madagascariensis TaxID=2747483 RepID=A0A8X6XIW7_9ARAC|nr:hypothetical protein TNIN_193651 [Trichonephila inaurata madagascariensis]